MLARRLITCLDIRAGRVVKGVRFESLREIGDPAELALRYEQEGADEVVILDVSATLEDRIAGVRSVERIRQRLSIPLTVGGGINSVEDAGRLLDAGADRVSVNTAAVLHPQLVSQLAERFGSQCVVVAIDAGRRQETVPPNVADNGSRWRVAVRSATHAIDLDPATWAAQAAALGAGEILLTSIDRDGTGAGYDLDLLRAVVSAVPIPVIASGGAKEPLDLVAALQAGADAVLIASMVHDGGWSVARIKQCMAQAGCPIARQLQENP
jgi:imidazole glycerol-phosphate synthase subunit HisF